MKNTSVHDEWTTHHFAQGNPKGECQGDVPALLRRVANTLEELGPIDVHDLIMGTDITEDGSWYHLTVYYDPAES